ncbi:4021_t:CDS:2 [Diversispora eburnea]|uniref:4021_t:CDS:1 n=1 Tax=Diversispora eburnea TaxID=1213867 RepID=A0A9N9BCQ2_9GLOM|nr:4021_t:CDS:2 [Diversispora eburnea]
MVNEVPEENFLEFSIKYLDAVFGTEVSNFEISDLSKPKILQPHDKNSTTTTLPPQINPVKDLQNEQISAENKKASSEFFTSKNNTIVSSSTEKFVPVVQLNGESKENSLEKRSSGLIDATLKRKSIIDLEDIEFNDDAEPITEELHIETDNPSHLFWVPAHLHPEIAPNEFRKWLKNHAKDGFNSGTISLRRRKSTLSRQYIPTENDDDEQPEKKVDTEKKSIGFDWENFAALDENISPSSESSKLKIIKRSLSLNFPPFMGSDYDPKNPNIFDRNSSTDVDSPILIHRMAPALKRTARTKIRRNSVAGEQNPHRFSAHRRTKSTHILSGKNKNGNLISNHPKKTSASLSLDKSDISDKEKIKPEENYNEIELAFIDSNDISGPIRITLKDNDDLLSVPSPQRTSSLPHGALEMANEFQEDQVPLPDKTKLYVDTVNTDNTSKPIPEMSSAWTSWLFGKPTDDNVNSSDSTVSQPPVSLNTDISNKKPKYTNYNRLPIHVERAIYRLSHIKLANPRRPLSEQVLISNMMFWYLSLINKQVEYGGEINPNAEKEAIKVKSKVGKSNGGRKRKKGEKKGVSSEIRRRGASSNAEIAYKAPQYDMQQISQQYTEEWEIYSESGKEISSENNEENYNGKYHHYGDGYVSDGTDGGYLDSQDLNGSSIESNHIREPVNNHLDMEESSKNRSRRTAPTQNQRAISPIRLRPSNVGQKKNNSQSPLTKVKKNLIAGNSLEEDEDDDIPLGLYMPK